MLFPPPFNLVKVQKFCRSIMLRKPLNSCITRNRIVTGTVPVLPYNSHDLVNRDDLNKTKVPSSYADKRPC